MGLASTVQQGVVSAFVALGDIAKPSTYRKMTGVMVRDLDAGTSAPQVIDYPIKLSVIVRFKESEIDENISVKTDAKFICPALFLPVEPKAADQIIDIKGRTWEIMRNMGDPADAAIILQIRKR